MTHFHGFDLAAAQNITAEALSGMEDGELFLEARQSEQLTFDDGRLKNASYGSGLGMGLRAVMEERTGYAHTNVMTPEALTEAASVVRAVREGYAGRMALATPKAAPRVLYPGESPVELMPFPAKIAVVQAIDAYVRAQDVRVRQVTVSLVTSWQHVGILRADAPYLEDKRPLLRLDVTVVLEENGRMERGHAGKGGRSNTLAYLEPESWQPQAEEALRQARVNLASVPAPAGEMDVVLGSGWPGVLLHEAVGHGLEGDFNRKGTSTFSGRIGQRVASPGVTVVDDGTMPGRRGSLTLDDEGTPTQRNVLIEDGILRGYMQDRLNARLMEVPATGNGRRESYAYAPLPRMTNTFMLAGDTPRAEMIKQVKRGIYAANFGGGQVDITSGKFVFSASEAYLIEDGVVTSPVKGATLIGNGPDTMQRIAAIGDDLALDDGIGTCGKAGQGVPVGVGQPSLLIRGLTVGGTEV